MSSTDLSIMLPAFVAGLLVLATHVPLGMSILARGIIFVDLAVAQIAGLGVIAASFLGLEENTYVVQAMAAGSALLGASLLAYAEAKLPKVQEATIGILFVFSASLGILLMSRDPHAGEHLKDLLVGQVLWVGTGQLIATAALTGVLLVLWRVLTGRLGALGFYVVFALAITASVQLVGVYLVFASLIVPALATHRLRKHRMPVAFAVGVAGYLIGLLLSLWLDLPAGAAIVCTMTLVGTPLLLWGRAEPV
jgi:zinc/manganese transport system permease protein